jgi:16S rRNA (guanine1516-N2)-methyltransferase
MYVWSQPQNSEQEQRAFNLATQLQLPLFIQEKQPDIKTDFYLTFNNNYLILHPQDKTLGKGLYVDFVEGKLAFRRKYGGGKQQSLARAFGLHKGEMPDIIDATAGLGRDAFVLANLGCQIQLIEFSNIIAALLENGLQRAQQDQEIGTWITTRLSLICADSKIFLRNLEKKPTAIYLDPMYPERQKSALVKKEMRIFRQFLAENDTGEELLDVALNVAQKRVVVKRPMNAPFLANKKPNAQIMSENTRFDLYFTFNQ